VELVLSAQSYSLSSLLSLPGPDCTVSHNQPPGRPWCGC